MLAKVITLKNSSSGKGFGPVMRYVMRADQDAEKLAEGERLEAGHMNFAAEGDDASPWFNPVDDDLSDPALRAGYAEDLAHLCEQAEAQCRARPASRFRGNPVYHVAINWREGEHPTREQAERTCRHVMNSLGCADHQAAWAIHRDTDNDHIHLVINRVHPQRLTVWSVPRRDYFILDKCMRELEIEFGHGRANGPWVTLDTPDGPTIVRMSRAERRERGLLKDAEPHIGARAARAEHNAGGAESFQKWVAGEPAAALRAGVDKPGATWRDAHEALARFGVRIEAKGSGLIVTTTVPGADGAQRVLAAKASQLGRWASRSALEQRLGEFTPPAEDLPPPASGQTYAEAVASHREDLEGEAPPRNDGAERDAGPKAGAAGGQAGGNHQQHHGQRQDHGQAGQQRGARDQEDRARRRAERQAERDVLAQRFAAGETERRAAAQRRREALRAKHAAERKTLAERLRVERKGARAELRAQGIDTRTADALFAFRAAAEREARSKRQRDERQALSAEFSRGMVWRVWLEQQAERGDEAAQAALRGIRYRAQRQRKKDEGDQANGIEGEPLDRLAALHEKLRRGPDDLILAALVAERDRRGRHITYRRCTQAGGGPGEVLFVDRGPRIDMLSKEDAALEAALRIASEKYGGRVLLTGSTEFQERAARMAARLGIRVTNSDLQGVVRDAHHAWAAARQREREHRKAAEERRSRAAAQEGRPTEQPQRETGSATPQSPAPPTVERPDPPRDQMIRWWNRQSPAVRAAWMTEAAAAGRDHTVAGAWHRWRDYQDAGRSPPAGVVAAREHGDRREIHRGREKER